MGKTHLLASLWHVAPEPKLFATFVELTGAGAQNQEAAHGDKSGNSHVSLLKHYEAVQAGQENRSFTLRNGLRRAHESPRMRGRGPAAMIKRAICRQKL